MQSAGLAKSKQTLHPAISFLRSGSQGSFSPEDTEADHTLGEVVRRIDSIFLKEKPETFNFLAQTPDERPRWILPVLIYTQNLRASLDEASYHAALSYFLNLR